MDQNKLMQSNNGATGRIVLDPQILTDLSKSNFTLGHAPTTYSSMSNSSFYDKSKMANKPESDLVLGQQLRQQNYSMGKTKLDYNTETQSKFQSRDQKPENR